MKRKSNEQINRIPLFDSHGKRSEMIEMDKDIFNGKFSESVLYQVSLGYLANKRSGQASTKTRGEVSGGGKKPWRQKGTGRARTSSIRNPIWRGGGIVFGPHPRDFRHAMSKKMKRAAFISSLNAKLKDAKIVAIENIEIDEPKTKKFTSILSNMKLKDKVLFLVDKLDKNLMLASRNVKRVTLRKIEDVTALDVLSSDHVVVTKSATEILNKRVKNEG